MYRTQRYQKSTIKVNKGYAGESIEAKVRRITNNKEPIKDGAPLVYTDRSEGVKPEYDIKTDRFEIAVDAMDAVTKAKIAKRESRGKKDESTDPKTTGSDKKDGGAEPIQTT